MNIIRIQNVLSWANLSQNSLNLRSDTNKRKLEKNVEK